MTVTVEGGVGVTVGVGVGVGAAVGVGVGLGVGVAVGVSVQICPAVMTVPVEVGEALKVGMVPLVLGAWKNLALVSSIVYPDGAVTSLM